MEFKKAILWDDKFPKMVKFIDDYIILQEPNKNFSLIYKVRNFIVGYDIKGSEFGWQSNFGKLIHKNARDRFFVWMDADTGTEENSVIVTITITWGKKIKLTYQAHYSNN